MTEWIRGLAAPERRAFIAAFGGWTMDAMDYQAFSFVIPSLLTLWGISGGEAGLLATVTLLVSALGGWLAGALADRFGRVRILQLTILWFAVFTFLNGFADGFGMLFTTRARCRGWASAANGRWVPSSSARSSAPSTAARRWARCRAAGRS